MNNDEDTIDTSAIDAEIAAAEAALAAAKVATSPTNQTMTSTLTPATASPAPAKVSPPVTPSAPATAVVTPTPVPAKTLVRRFNRQKFFDGYKAAFGGLTQSQVSGLESLLSSLEQDKDLTYVTYMAYMLATLKHETADNFQPITEYGGQSYFNRYDPVLADTATRRATARLNGNTQKGDGYKYRGRGFVQITWKNNYRKLGTAVGYDLVTYPEKALDPVIAYKIMSYGMRTGAFTGKKLSDYMNDRQADYREARRIINALDKADTIKSYAVVFEKILRNSIT
jgi:putative chitinase